MPPIFSVVIVNWNTRDLLIKCLGTLFNSGQPECEVIVVDNDSQDDSVAMVRARFPQVRIVENKDNAGFARGNNIGVENCNTPFALLLNTDAFPQPGALVELIKVANANSKVGIVGAHLINTDGSFQASHTAFPTLGREFLILSGLGRLLFGRHYPSAGPSEGQGAQAVHYVEGACLLVNVEAYRAVGGFDEAFFMYSEEVDLCFRIKQAGWQVWYVPNAKITHLGGASSKDRKTEREGDLYRSRVRFFRKHYGAGAAQWLKLLIYMFTLPKIAVHTLLRRATGGRLGRPVVPLGLLARQLNDL